MGFDQLAEPPQQSGLRPLRPHWVLARVDATPQMHHQAMKLSIDHRLVARCPSLELARDGCKRLFNALRQALMIL
jgi:hypothetical protein